MDGVFLGHVSTQFVPGRNLTWYAVFLLSLGVHLLVLANLGGRDVQMPASGALR